MKHYCHSLTSYHRLLTKEVSIGDLRMGNMHPIRLQTMTTKDTMDTIGTVEETIRCYEAGADLVRITAPSKKEAENLLSIKKELIARGYNIPLVADIHFTPNAAEIAARIVEKVRINPGNYVDKKKFKFIEYTDDVYSEEMDRIRDKFVPLLKICKEYGTAMRIGTNHGSLSDRIMSRYGDTPIGMVESAMEFLRIARDEQFHNIVLSMKSSNTQVMVQAYRLLVKQMNDEFGELYPLHLGVTEAGDGEDGRIKSAVGIGTLLEDGIGDTIRVSLTEDPELEIPVCRDIVKRYPSTTDKVAPSTEHLPYNPFQYSRRKTTAVANIGAEQVPVVLADFSQHNTITADTLKEVGYTYSPNLDKWHIADTAADYILLTHPVESFQLPTTIKAILPASFFKNNNLPEHYYPLFSSVETFVASATPHKELNFIQVDCNIEQALQRIENIKTIAHFPNIALILSSHDNNAMLAIRHTVTLLMQNKITCPIILHIHSKHSHIDEQLIHFSTEAGALLLDGFGDGLLLTLENNITSQLSATGRNYQNNESINSFLNSTAFSILQATRTRISKTEYISCPSCGRTLFDLQETTAKIRAVTHHLKGIKIAIMGCIVNGPGEMADADFGYVGSGIGKITLYKGKDVVKRNIDSEIAVQELIDLLKEHNAWVEAEN